VAAVCVVSAVRRLRKQALKETGTARSAQRRAQQRPPIGERPMVWKEVYVEAHTRTGWFHRAVIIVLVIASFVPAVLIVINVVAFNAFSQGDEFRIAMGAMARTVGTLVTCLVLLGIGVRASGSVTGERERRTLEGLLTTPLDSDAILYGKWLGSILGHRRAWAWPASIIVIGLVTGGVHLVAVPFLLIAWAVYARFMASLGLWNSVTQRTALRANVATVAGAGIIAFGHWLLWMCIGPLLFLTGGLDQELLVKWIGLFEAFGLTPPLTLGLLTFQGWEFDGSELLQTEIGGMMLCAVIGVALYAVAERVLWSEAVLRFSVTSGRSDRLPQRSQLLEGSGPAPKPADNPKR
jgi:ABC-type transport system involved in multi-copper enzyme maturation permease subunit